MICWIARAALLQSLVFPQSLGDLVAEQVSLNTALTHAAFSGPRLAVIGGGIAGVTVPFEIRKTSNLKIDITIFERHESVGGYIRSWRQGDFDSLLEDGASRFSTNDHCLMNAVNMTNLTHIANMPGWGRQSAGYGMGVSTKKLETFCDVDAANAWKLVRLFWRYGYAGLRAHRMIASVIERWHIFLHHPVNDLGQAIEEAGFNSELASSASQWWKTELGSDTISSTVLQPCSLRRRCAGLNRVSALDSMLSTQQGALTSILGGNSLLPEAMQRAGNSRERLNTTVHAILPGEQHRYRLVFNDQDWEEFDVVVLATPLATSGIDIQLPGIELDQYMDISFEDRHVTYVKTAAGLSTSFNATLKIWIDSDSTLVQTGENDNIISFEPLTIVRPGCHGCDYYFHDWLYRITSRERLSDTELEDMLDGQNDNQSSIIWSTRHSWPSAVPVVDASKQRYLPRSAELLPGLFYTAGLETLVSSLEMSCRMGSHVGRKVVEFLEENSIAA